VFFQYTGKNNFILIAHTTKNQVSKMNPFAWETGWENEIESKFAKKNVFYRIGIFVFLFSFFTPKWIYFFLKKNLCNAGVYFQARTKE
jgi:hypothetical protein